MCALEGVVTLLGFDPESFKEMPRICEQLPVGERGEVLWGIRI